MVPKLIISILEYITQQDNMTHAAITCLIKFDQYKVDKLDLNVNII